jgi:thiamine biosynthesis lipoprotein
MKDPGWVSFGALGSTAVVAVADATRLDQGRAAVEQVVGAFDESCSRFREDSELERLNRAGGEALPASPLLLDAVAAAVRAAELTDGDVDPTVGEALIALGYDRDWDELPRSQGAARRVRIAAVPGWRTVQLSREAGTVQLGRGVRLDLGATAKALAADRAAAAASQQTGCGVLVSLGGDIAIAGPAPVEGWRVRVTDDHRSDWSAPGQWIALEGGGLATSSTTVRRWPTAEGTAHHVIDPATGRPATGFWRTVSVAAGSCLDANIASTAAIVRGEPALGWLRSLELPSRLVGEDGHVRHVAGWPVEGDDLPMVEEVAV